MAENVPSGVAAASSTAAGDMPAVSSSRGHESTVQNVAMQQLSSDPMSSISHPHIASYVRPPGVQQPCLTKVANEVNVTGLPSGPRNVVLHRHNGDFGFTLRHFIVYPPDSITDPVVNLSATVGVLNFAQPMDTVFVKKVHPNTAAHMAGLMEGDRLLAVNGHTVASIPYSQVVATIQQTPKTLTLQVVPKNYDILQTFFSETAYNPDTNQRPAPQVCAPKVSMSITHPETHQSTPLKLLSMTSAQKEQQSLYSTLQEIVVDNADSSSSACSKNRIYDDVPKILDCLMPSAQQSPQVPLMLKMAAPAKVSTGYGTGLLKQQESFNVQPQQKQYQQQPAARDMDHKPSALMNYAGVMANDDYTPPGQGDRDRMFRLLKSLEQKEQFLRRPTSVTSFEGGVLDHSTQTVATGRSRANRQHKFVWPPSLQMPAGLQKPATNAANTDIRDTTSTSGSISSSATMRNHLSQLSSIREQFFIGGAGVADNLDEASQVPSKSAPPSLTIAASPARSSSLDGTFSVASLPIPSQTMHVSDKAKLFESGRTLSPERFDRIDLYKSELSRINTKQVVPNVAVRRKEFEQKAEGTSRRMSVDEKPRSAISDHDSRVTPIRMRSFSDEPNVTHISFGSASFPATDPLKEDIETNTPHVQCQQHVHANVKLGSTVATLHQDPGKVESHQDTTRNWTEVPGPTVVMRQKQQHSANIGKDRKVRRISYLRATARENLCHVMECDEASNPLPANDKTSQTVIESITIPSVHPQKQYTTSVFTADGPLTTKKSLVPTLQPLQLMSHNAKCKILAHFRDGAADQSAPLLRQGELNIKVTLIDGKRSTDRSWRFVHAELRGNHLKLTHVRDNKSSTQTPETCGTIDLTNFRVTEGNYTKRKHVFKLATLTAADPYPLNSAAAIRHTEEHLTQSTPGLPLGGWTCPAVSHEAVENTVGTSSVAGSAFAAKFTGSERELLLQADSQNDMQQWMDSLRSVCADGREDVSEYVCNLGGQQAEPQYTAAQTSVQSNSGNSGDEYSRVVSTESHRKHVLGTSSPAGEIPFTNASQTNAIESTRTVPLSVIEAVSSSRQTTASSSQFSNNQPVHQLLVLQQQQLFGNGKDSSDRDSGSPKSKTWKGIVARQFRKMQGQSAESLGSGHTPDLMVLPDGASINVPLHFCPVSKDNPFVPLVLAKCTGIVESKGLNVVGIYRIPGNTAAITHLTETINRGLDEAALRDPRWEDVNVVSSLLKSFIRNLPEPLLPDELYGRFINADKLSGLRRLIELRQLLRRTPPMNYETLKHLMRHLYCVSTNSEINLMDPRNLAIVFGPSVVRSVNESLETAVKDMRHQCQIVEVLINYYQYFFEDAQLPTLDEKIIDTTVVDSGLDDPSTSLLLDNVSKIEPLKDSSKESSSGFVAHIVQAANRKIRRSAQRKSTMSSSTPDTLSLDSTMSAESKEQSLRITRRCVNIKGRTALCSQPNDDKPADDDPTMLRVKPGLVKPTAAIPPNTAQHLHHLSKSEENPLQLHHHHHHHHHYYHNSRYHNTLSNDDASAVSNRSSEDDSNDSTYADNGSMSLKTVTIALDHKLRSMRNSSIDADRVLKQECDDDLSNTYDMSAAPVVGSARHSLHQQYFMGRASRPLTLGENIPYADESPERPLVQSRSKPLRQAGFFSAHAVATKNSNITSGKTPNAINYSIEDDPLKAVEAPSTLLLNKKSFNASGDESSTLNSNSNNSCLMLVNEMDTALGVDAVAIGDATTELVTKGRDVPLSSDETDSSTTSVAHDKLTATTYRIDTEVLKKMNRILTQLERKANNLERKFNLNRSVSLNYKSPKAIDCCCLLPNPHPHTQAQPQLHYWSQQQHHKPPSSNSASNCYTSTGINNLRVRLSLTKNEKTDKNINRRRLIQDAHSIADVAGDSSGGCVETMAEESTHENISGSKNSNSSGEPSSPRTNLAACCRETTSANVGSRQRRQTGSRSIRRRHTVGGTRDYVLNKINNQDYLQYHVGQDCCSLRQN